MICRLALRYGKDLTNLPGIEFRLLRVFEDEHFLIFFPVPSLQAARAAPDQQPPAVAPSQPLSRRLRRLRRRSLRRRRCCRRHRGLRGRSGHARWNISHLFLIDVWIVHTYLFLSGPGGLPHLQQHQQHPHPDFSSSEESIPIFDDDDDDDELDLTHEIETDV